MQSGSGGAQQGGENRRSVAVSASESQSSSSSVVSASQLGFDQQCQQQRQGLQQQLLRRPEGNEAILAYNVANMHGILGGASSASPSSSMQLPQQSRKFTALGQQHDSQNNREEGQYRSQSFEQQLLNPFRQASMPSAFQAAQQQSAPGIQSQQQMNIGTLGAPAKDQDARMGNMTMLELISMQGCNRSIASSSRKPSEQFFLSEKQTYHGQQPVSDRSSDQKPPKQPTLFGQALPLMTMQAPQSQKSNQNVANNRIMAAQMQGMQALALEQNIDMPHPANANMTTPLYQSRVIAQQKSNENNMGRQSLSVPMPKQYVASPQVANESSAPDYSSRDVSGLSGSAKPRQTVSTSLFGVTLSSAPVDIPSDINAQQFFTHERENQWPPRQPTLTGNRTPQMNLSQTSVNVNQGADNSFPGQNAPSVPDYTPMQNGRQLNCVSTQTATSSNYSGLGNDLASWGGPASERQPPPLGFTNEQYKTLRAQITALKHITDRKELPPEKLEGIVPPPLEIYVQQAFPSAGGIQDKSAGKHVEDHARRLKSSEEGTHIGTYAFASDWGKVVASAAAVLETAQVSKAVEASAVSPPKGASSSGKYQGPLFDFPDSFGSSMMINDNTNLVLGYDIKDLLIENGTDFVKRKREESIKKIGDILALNSQRKRIRPDLVLRLKIEEKKLQLADVQARLRDEIEQQQQEIMAMPERPYRKFVRLCEHQRLELAKQVQESQKAARENLMKSIFQWRKKLFEAHWAIRDARTARNRGIAKYHEKMLREFSKRKDNDRDKRMEALQNDDVERYREMLLEQQTKIPGDAAERYAVLSSFLTQTEEYLQKLGSKITATKNQEEVEEAAAAAVARAQGLSKEELRAAAACAREQVMIRNRFIEMNAPRDSSSVNKYHNLAHAVNERVLKQPSMLRAGTLREYQLVGLQWMLSLYNNKLNGILADEMGLGKTVQVIALIAYLMEFKGNYGPYLIIVPNAVLLNWKSELQTWLPSVSCIFYAGGKDQRSKLFSQEVMAMKFNVLVTTYEFIMFDRAKLSKIDWKYIIIDEAQRMKDRESVLARELDKYRCQRRLLLTGTPLQNDLKELWSLLNLLLPEVFDNRKAFHDWFSQPFQKEGTAHNAEDDWLETEKKVIIIHRLHQILEPFMLRRRVEDVEGSLPPKDSVVLRCRMSAIQSAIYDWIKSTGTLRVDPKEERLKAHKNSIYQPKTYKTLSNRCMELRKTCNHPLLNYPYFDDLSKDFLVKSCGKLWVLDRILLKLQRTGHRVLLFSTMTKLLDILEEYLQWRRLVFRRIDGTTSLEDRESAIVDFNSPDTNCFIFLLSIRAAGRGLNLQSADTVIIYDPDPNPKNEEQAVARAHRIGQTREVKVIYMEAVVDKIPSHQKEDIFRSGGIVDSDEDLACKDRYMGSIESLIRKNIQQYKIDMANEVINAGRFDQRTTHEERRLTLESLLHDEDRLQETVHDIPSLWEMNRMIARSDEEAELFDQIDEDLEWAEEMTRFDEVPQWLRPSTKEVDATVANLSKRPSKNTRLGGSHGLVSNELVPETEKSRGRPKRKKFPVYTELDDDNKEFSKASSQERNGYDEEGEVNEFEEDEVSGASGPPPLNKDQPEEDGAMSGEGLDCAHASEITKNASKSTRNTSKGAKNNSMVEACLSGSSLKNQRSSRMVSRSVSSQKFISLSALDTRRGSHSKRMSNELEEGEIAVSGDPHINLQQSGCWIQDRDEGEDEQVLRPNIKRKRSVRVRPRRTAELTEEKLNERPSLHRGDPHMPFEVEYNYDSQNANNHEHKALVKPSASKNDSMDSSLKHRQDLPLRKVSRTAKFDAPHKSGRESDISANDASEHSKGNCETQVMKGSGTSGNGKRMHEVTQRKCKKLITRLRKKIKEEGQRAIPTLNEFWNSIENYNSRVRAGDSLLDLRTIDLRIENSYCRVIELVDDVKLMLEHAVQYFKFSDKVKREADKVRGLFFDILKRYFPKNADRMMSPDRVPHKETRLNDSGSQEIGLKDGSSFAHPGDLVICKKKRKDRENPPLKPRSSSASPASPAGVGCSVRSLGTVKAAKDAKFDRHVIQQGWASQSPPQASSGGSSVGWANHVKKMRTGAAERRPSNS